MFKCQMSVWLNFCQSAPPEFLRSFLALAYNLEASLEEKAKTISLKHSKAHSGNSKLCFKFDITYHMFSKEDQLQLNTIFQYCNHIPFQRFDLNILPKATNICRPILKLAPGRAEPRGGGSLRAC